MEFMDLEKNEEGKKSFVWQNKKTFILNLAKVGSILALPNQFGSGYNLGIGYLMI